MARGWEITILIAGALLMIPWIVGVAAFGPLAIIGVPLTAIAALAVYWRVRAHRLGRDRAPRPPGPLPEPIPAEAADDLRGVPEPVTACPQCGFLGIRMPTIGDGLWPGGGETGSRMVCPRCHYQGMPVRFDKRQDYGEFLRELAE